MLVLKLYVSYGDDFGFLDFSTKEELLDGRDIDEDFIKNPESYRDIKLILEIGE